jgi:hypothetical protein
MRPFSVIASVLVSHLRHAGGALAIFLNPFRDVRKYRPERHYICAVPDRNGAKSILTGMLRPRAAPEVVNLGWPSVEPGMPPRNLRDLSFAT